MEMKYEKKGLRFYYLLSQAREGADADIILIGFRPPFEGKTEEGIILGKSSMEDVFQALGRENWLTADNDKYFWVDYSGISFYVERDPNKPPFPFIEKDYLQKSVARITIPIADTSEDTARNEDGKYIHSMEDFCVDGKGHFAIFDENRAERICSKCGLVLSERMISLELSGQRAFSTEERDKREQHGSPVSALIPDIQMATMIDKRAPMSEGLRKAVKWDSRYSWKQRNMIQATSEIKRMGELLNVPQHVKEYCVKIYRRAFQKGLLKGRSIKAMVAASLYYACGAEQIPRTLQEIVKVSDSNFHDVTRSYQTLIKDLNLSSPTLPPSLLVSKFITELNLNHQIEVLAQKILDRYEKVYSLSGKDPKGLVAAALYIAALREKIKISQTKISRSIGITEVTLRNRLREMQRFLKRVD